MDDFGYRRGPAVQSYPAKMKMKYFYDADYYGFKLNIRVFSGSKETASDTAGISTICSEGSVIPNMLAAVSLR